MVQRRPEKGNGWLEIATEELRVKAEEHAASVDTQEISSIIVRAMAPTKQL